MKSIFKKYNTSRFWLTVLAILIYIIGIFFYSINLYDEQKETITKDIDNRLKEAALSVDFILEKDFHDRALDSSSISQKEFDDYTHKLGAQSDVYNVRYIYSAIVLKNKLYLTSSSEKTNNIVNKLNIVNYFDEYTDADTAFFKAFYTNTITYCEYTDKWGSFRSIVIPKTTTLGHKYLLCADIEISFLKWQLLSEIPYTILRSLILLLLGLPLALITIKNYRKYSKDLEKQVKERTEVLDNEIRTRHLLENTLRQSEQKFSIAFNRVPVPMFIMDTLGIILEVNSAFENIVKSKKYFYDVSILSIPFFNAKEDFEYIISQIKTQNTVLNYKMSYLNNGTPTNCSLSAELIYLNNKQYLIAIVYDTSVHEKYEKELKLAKEKAEENDNLKSSFLANMSHEVRTPLNAIIGFSELLKDANIDEAQRNDFIDIVTSNSRNLLALINDIIDISKIEAGQLKISKTKCNLNNILQEVLQLYLNERKNRNKEQVELFINLDLQNEDSNLNIDEVRLRQILNNILTNALKFTNTGKIEFGYKISNNDILFYVQDTGIGIKEDSIEKIFDRFKQVDEGKSRKYGGTGLGLAITKAIVELMNGKIWVESTYGAGSTFFFTIPFEPIDNKCNSKIVKNSINPKIDLSPYIFLVVEDEETSFYFLKTILEKNGGKVIHAKNGVIAIDIIKNKTHVDLVLMDMHMPQITGCDTAKEIRKLNPSVPMIAQTADAHTINRNQVLMCGLNDYITKPIDKEKLFSIIVKLLKINQLDSK